ncbi:MAG: DMT family transporter [Pseudomonadota bacterium]
MQAKVVFLYIVMCLVWGTTWLAIKFGVESLSPILFTASRFLAATIILGLVLLAKKVPLRLVKSEVKPILFLSVFGIALPFSLVSWGEQYTNSAMGAIIMCALPLAIFPISYLLKSFEKLTSAKLLGVIVGFAGVSFIFYPALIAGVGSLKGNLALIMAMLVCSIATVYLKKYTGHISVSKCLFFQMAFACPMLISAGLLIESPTKFLQGLANWQALAAIFYLAIFGSIIALGSYYWLLKRIGAVASTVSIFLEVVLAVFLDWLIFAAIPHYYTWFGVVLIFMGVWLVMVGVPLPLRTSFWQKVFVKQTPA